MGLFVSSIQHLSIPTLRDGMEKNTEYSSIKKCVEHLRIHEQCIVFQEVVMIRKLFRREEQNETLFGIE